MGYEVVVAVTGKHVQVGGDLSRMGRDQAHPVEQDLRVLL